jgi:hypothetical protein
MYSHIICNISNDPDINYCTFKKPVLQCSQFDISIDIDINIKSINDDCKSSLLNYMQNNVANLSRLNMSDTMSSSRSSHMPSSIPLPVIVLVVLHFAKKMIPEELRKTVANPMVAGGVAVFLFYQNRKNMIMAVLYAVLAYYVLSSMASRPKQEAKQ